MFSLLMNNTARFPLAKTACPFSVHFSDLGTKVTSSEQKPLKALWCICESFCVSQIAIWLLRTWKTLFSFFSSSLKSTFRKGRSELEGSRRLYILLETVRLMAQQMHGLWRGWIQVFFLTSGLFLDVWPQANLFVSELLFPHLWKWL